MFEHYYQWLEEKELEKHDEQQEDEWAPFQKVCALNPLVFKRFKCHDAQFILSQRFK